jgi:LmbE family N-acetylglucosaminyl deacetylase
MRRQMAAARQAEHEFGPEDFDPDSPMDDGNPMGMPEAELTTVVDVSDFVDNKHRAISAHASQVTDAGFFTRMTPETFAFAFGREWYIEHGRQPGLQPGWLFDHV